MAWIWKRKSVIVSSLIVVVSLFLVVMNYSEKPYFLLQPVFGQSFSRNWMFSRPPHKAFKPHRGYLSIPNQEPLKLHCEVCSIVSSSGQMLGREAGAEIDQSSCIWRMNNAPTRGFEIDVGRRTDLRVVSHTSVPLLIQKPQHFFGQGNETVYVVWGPLRNMRQDGKGIVYNMLRQAVDNYPQARIYVTTEERMNYCDTVFKKETGKDRLTHWIGGWEPCCTRWSKGRSAQCCTSAGSFPRERQGTAPLRRSVWPSSRRSSPFGTTSWDGLSPSVRTTPRSSGSIT
ncbi:alpha-N-acetylgalactosaminide alpha-2,6-sialyltransferase 3-like isoform X2 [Myxocyprinus asiaticus]|uniref:alpha-N-acetylgalactosaminide alpha-2,6-sialyltransferase 3-like isoform X2 n=1 Tax=Myxocyprinus asiaticus TaxID=70543 RepID=UPI0022215F5F|nr:alpha-N-acetylgalactosaminide alpha-2,6-sialyltransferase 3-like isoform X2 [Myxocyprinus asiaticus]